MLTEQDAALCERLLKGNVPKELVEYAGVLVEEVISRFRAKIADGGLSVEEQIDLLNTAVGYHELQFKDRATQVEAAAAIERLSKRVAELEAQTVNLPQFNNGEWTKR